MLLRHTAMQSKRGVINMDVTNNNLNTLQYEEKNFHFANHDAKKRYQGVYRHLRSLCIRTVLLFS